MCHVIVDIRKTKIKRKVFFIAALNIVQESKNRKIHDTQYHMFCAKDCCGYTAYAVVSIVILLMFTAFLPKQITPQVKKKKKKKKKKRKD